MRRYHYLIYNQIAPVTLVTDHRNFLAFNNSNKSLKFGSYKQKIVRWTIFVQLSGIKVEHIEGKNNVFADLLSRWGFPEECRSLLVYVERDELQMSRKRKRNGYHLSRSMKWTKAEEEMLRKLIKRYGVGKWSDIMKSNYLPGKTVAQLVSKVIRSIGQQQIKEFSGMKIDIRILRKLVMKREGTRINKLLINNGNRIGSEELMIRRKENERNLRRYLNLYEEILPLRREEVSGSYFEECPTDELNRYLEVLEKDRNYLTVKEKIRKWTLRDYRGDVDKRVQEWCKYRYILKNSLVEKDNLHRWFLRKKKKEKFRRKSNEEQAKKETNNIQNIGNMIEEMKKTKLCKENNEIKGNTVK